MTLTLKTDNIVDKQIKFYETNWFMWLMLVFFAPVGIFLMWKNEKFTKTTKKALSVMFALWFVFVAVNSSNNNNNNNSNGAKDKTVQTSQVNAKTTEEIKKEADDKANAEAEQKSKDEEAAAKAKADEEANKTVDQVVSEIAKKKFSDRFISVTFEDSEKTKLILTIKVADNLTNNMVKTGMLGDVNGITKELSTNEKFKTLKQFTVVHQAEFVDKLGATSNGNAQIVSLSMDIINKIQWNNFDYNNFPSIATSFYIHPSFNQK